MSEDNKKKTLRAEDIESRHGMGRRSMLGIVSGGLALGATAVVMGNQNQAEAQEAQPLGVNDSDPSDPANRGRTGATDRDSRGGPDGNGDPGGFGVCPSRGTSDSDSGGSADPASGGRGPCR